MHYVLDTSFIRMWRDYYPKIFPTFWAKITDAVKLNQISSSSEVKREIENYGGKQGHLIKWIKDHSYIFSAPSTEEQVKVREIFAVSDFQNLLKRGKMQGKDPFADPFIIAKAMVIGDDGVVVTKENPASKGTRGQIQGSPKIPDVCHHFGVACISPDKFMEKQGWQF